jgi:quercetin dioxygenase-like cupin family protein
MHAPFREWARCQLSSIRGSTRHLRTKFVFLLVVLVLAVISVGVAFATTGEGSVGTLLSRGANPDAVKVHTDLIKFKTRGATDLFVVTQTWQPGGHSGWHSHQGLVLLALKTGTLTVFDDECNARTIAAGEAFVEASGMPMEVKNYGEVPAVAYFAIVNPPGAPGRDDAANPGCDIP